ATSRHILAGNTRGNELTQFVSVRRIYLRPVVAGAVGHDGRQHAHLAKRPQSCAVESDSRAIGAPTGIDLDEIYIDSGFSQLNGRGGARKAPTDYEYITD